MANLKLLLLSICLIFSIMTSSISTEEVEANNQTTSSEEIPEEETITREQEDLSQGNILESPENMEIVKKLNFDTKEVLTKEDVKLLFEKVFLRPEFGGDELQFFQKMIDSVINEVPEEVPNAELKNFFEVPFLMKYIEQNTPSPEDDEEEDVSQKGEKKDEI